MCNSVYVYINTGGFGTEELCCRRKPEISERMCDGVLMVESVITEGEGHACTPYARRNPLLCVPAWLGAWYHG